MKGGIIKILATFFGIGYLPYCPGTWASLVGVGIYFLLRNHLIIYTYLSIALFVVGFIVCGKAERLFVNKDASVIVIDEISAILILLRLVPQSLFFLILSFLMFRVIDIIKPYPIKKIEKFSGSWGIMGDDLLACFYTLCFIWIVIRGGSCG